MLLFQKFQLVQFFIIFFSSLIGTWCLRKINSPERKYILTLCYLDLLIMSFGIYNYINDKYPGYLYLMEFAFIFSETFFLTYYISEIIGKRKKILYLIIAFLISALVSIKFFKDITRVPELTAGLFLSYYSYLYFKWLFSQNHEFSLTKTKHYWIVLGIVLCYTTSIPFFFGYLIIALYKLQDLKYSLILILFTTYVVLNSIMYIFFIKAFLIKAQLEKGIDINHAH